MICRRAIKKLRKVSTEKRTKHAMVMTILVRLRAMCEIIPADIFHSYINLNSSLYISDKNSSSSL